MKINKVLAQEIADKVMTVIPYNVNIMDETGMIIGSGDANRKGSFHQGAIAAIEQNTIVCIYDLEGPSMPGVNIPIHFRKNIIGVIGISGEPAIVEPFAELVRVTAELLINQEYLYTERRIQEQMKEEFLYQWVFRQDHYDAVFKNNGEAMGINLTMERMAIIVKGETSKEPYLKDQEFSFKLNHSALLFIVPTDSDILKRLEQMNTHHRTKIGIGGSTTLVSKSVHEAERSIDIAEKLTLPSTFCYYQELKFIDYLTNKDLPFSEIGHFFKEFETTPKGQELIETLLCYIKNSGDMNAISKELHIHRNSLAYRLQRIEILTSKNPKKFTDLFQLYTGYVIYKMKHSD
ncbi:sugar diacid recognition domain-containing protein [Neobacillus sp. 179-C4.2 HS]|uniref:Sugar diacid recognition domain-containing protein n=1 Tax=Neobacillus driksii TaxID=3035913 RepID=A0ABV4YZR6_9BACI|nr:sugar diacid recognition domain-containing protein [Neobacillus sp. 179.-C4.2 HS]MDP5197439.1 sugar diacid recognition domain-containing protein [Neobacillus sp. 179.-C4.2 HS]